MTNLVSVGIPFYNSEDYLEFAILSVLAQTYQNWELILVDDGSTDNSLSIAKKFACKDERIRVICDGENKKLPYRLNQLIQESKGNFIVRMDADDVMHPDRLSIQIGYLNNHNDIDLVSSGLISIDSKNSVRGYRSSSNIITKLNSKKRFPIVHPSVTARREWYLRNNYSLNFPRAEDLELWNRTFISNDLNIAILPDLLIYYREFGNISKEKLINSYNDGFKIREFYKLPNSKFNFFTKKMIVKILDSLGLLQYLVNNRNKRFNSNEKKKYYQSILNNIILK